MPAVKFPSGVIRIKDHENSIKLAQYIGMQVGACSVCDRTDICHTFNIFSSEVEYNKGHYKTVFYDRKHCKAVEVI